MMNRQPNPLPPANSRRPFRFLRLWEIRCSLASSVLGSPAAVAEGGRWATERVGPGIPIIFLFRHN